MVWKCNYNLNYSSDINLRFAGYLYEIFSKDFVDYVEIVKYEEGDLYFYLKEFPSFHVRCLSSSGSVNFTFRSENGLWSPVLADGLELYGSTISSMYLSVYLSDDLKRLYLVLSYVEEGDNCTSIISFGSISGIDWYAFGSPFIFTKGYRLPIPYGLFKYIYPYSTVNTTYINCRLLWFNNRWLWFGVPSNDTYYHWYVSPIPGEEVLYPINVTCAVIGYYGYTIGDFDFKWSRDPDGVTTHGEHREIYGQEYVILKDDSSYKYLVLMPYSEDYEELKF